MIEEVEMMLSRFVALVAFGVLLSGCVSNGNTLALGALGAAGDPIID